MTTLTSNISEKLGMHSALTVGYVGLLLFMVGDGVEAGYLSPFLASMKFPEARIALVFTLYGATAALASWLSGVLSDLFGPRSVMWTGLAIWIVFEIPFLLLGIAHANYSVIAVTYMLRGFGYPLFAFGFLVWITRITPQRFLGTAVGWFWCARTGGLPTLGSLLASFAVPHYGAYATLWISSVLVVIGGMVAMVGTRTAPGAEPVVLGGTHPLAVLFSGISVAWKEPKVGLGGIVAAITTTSEFGFLVFLPIYYVQTVGFTLQQWLQILSIMFATNVVCNCLWGKIADRIGWRVTITFAGACGCAVTTLGLYYIPHNVGANYLLVTIAGMRSHCCHHGHVCTKVSGRCDVNHEPWSGTSIWLGPAIAGVCLPLIGISGTIWTFAGLYLISALISWFLRTPASEQVPTASLSAH